MPRPRKKEQIVGRYFVWLLGKRGEVYVADGRSNTPPLGRHSLDTKDHRQALLSLQRLDLVMAIKAGRAERSLLEESKASGLELENGWQLYRAHVGRPRVTGGAKPVTSKRYRAVFGKFLPFAISAGLVSWDQVTRGTLESYAAWLDGEGYSYATEYLELTTLKQCNKWLIEQGHLPPSARIQLPLRKPEGTDTYCWRREEVQAIVEHCQSEPALRWLADVVLALAGSGLRISELASLRWTDIDFDANVLSLTDESTRARRKSERKARETKNRRSRAFPLQESLRAVLQQKPRSDGVIFHGPQGGVLKPDTVRRILVRDVLTPLAERFPAPNGEVGFIDGRLHSFRHFFCSAAANAGVPEQVLMTWLGHRSSKMVRLYYHLHDEEAQRQMQRLKIV